MHTYIIDYCIGYTNNAIESLNNVLKSYTTPKHKIGTFIQTIMPQLMALVADSTKDKEYVDNLTQSVAVLKYLPHKNVLKAALDIVTNVGNYCKVNNSYYVNSNKFTSNKIDINEKRMEMYTN